MLSSAVFVSVLSSGSGIVINLLVNFNTLLSAPAQDEYLQIFFLSSLNHYNISETFLLTTKIESQYIATANTVKSTKVQVIVRPSFLIVTIITF